MNEVGCNKLILGEPSWIQYQSKSNKRCVNSQEFRSLLNKKQHWSFANKRKKFLPENEKSFNSLKLLPTKMAVSDVVSRKSCVNSVSLCRNELSSHVNNKRSSVKSICIEEREPTARISMANNALSHLLNNCSSDVAHSPCSPPWDKLLKNYEILNSENSGCSIFDGSVYCKNSQIRHVQTNQQKRISYKPPKTYKIIDYVDNANELLSVMCNELNSNILKASSKPFKEFRKLHSEVLSLGSSAVDNEGEGNMLGAVNIENKKVTFNAHHLTTEDFIQMKKVKNLRSCNQPLSSSSYSSSSNCEELRKLDSEFVLDVTKHYFHDNRMNLSALELFSCSNVSSSERMDSDLSGCNDGEDCNDNFSCNEESFKIRNKINYCYNTKMYYDSIKSTSENYISLSSDENKNDIKVTSHSEGVEIEKRDADIEE